MGESSKAKRGLPAIEDGLNKPLDRFGSNHLVGNGPLVLRTSTTGLGQRRALQVRQADRFFRERGEVNLGWAGPKKNPTPE